MSLILRKLDPDFIEFQSIYLTNHLLSVYIFCFLPFFIWNTISIGILKKSLR